MSQLLAQILGKSNWLVVGDVTNKQKPASRVFQRLLQHGKSVMGLNPRLGAEDASRSGVLRSVDEVSKQLKGQPLDVVDLIIHPSQGIQLVRELHSKVGFQYLFIQPGAESPEIIAFCNKSNIEFVQNCVLRQLPESKL